MARPEVGRPNRRRNRRCSGTTTCCEDRVTSKRGLGLLEVLGLRGFDPRTPAKLVRHRSRRYDMQELVQRGWLEPYQSFQGRPVFDGCGQIVSFVGLEGSRAQFTGIYRVGARIASLRAPFPADCP